MTEAGAFLKLTALALDLITFIPGCTLMRLRLIFFSKTSEDLSSCYGSMLPIISCLACFGGDGDLKIFNGVYFTVLEVVVVEDAATDEGTLITPDPILV